jgi:hypothetical protein
MVRQPSVTLLSSALTALHHVRLFRIRRVCLGIHAQGNVGFSNHRIANLADLSDVTRCSFYGQNARDSSRLGSKERSIKSSSASLVRSDLRKSPSMNDTHQNCTHASWRACSRTINVMASRMDACLSRDRHRNRCRPVRVPQYISSSSSSNNNINNSSNNSSNNNNQRITQMRIRLRQASTTQTSPNWLNL